MVFQFRLSSGPICYPLPTSQQPLSWQSNRAGVSATMHLGELPENYILVPSFCSPDAARFQFSLLDDNDNESLLQAVPSTSSDTSPKNNMSAASSHIDCWHTHTPIADTKLKITLTNAPNAPYLLTATARPLVQHNVSTTELASACKIDHPPRLLSQMMAEDKHIDDELFYYTGKNLY